MKPSRLKHAQGCFPRFKPFGRLTGDIAGEYEHCIPKVAPLNMSIALGCHGRCVTSSHNCPSVRDGAQHEDVESAAYTQTSIARLMRWSLYS